MRGWFVLDGCWFVPHGVVRHRASRKLIDITPESGNSSSSFVEHFETEQDFAVMWQGRDGGWLYPELDLLSAG